jgi:hypothetical protein
MHISGGNGVNGQGVHVANATATIAGCTITGNHSTGAGGGLLAAITADVTLIDTRITENSAPDGGGIWMNDSHLRLDSLSRVTRNTATNGPGYGGGIRSFGGTAELPSMANVTDNVPDNCSGAGTVYSGPGSVCTDP